jgi:hypothetical protein
MDISKYVKKLDLPDNYQPPTLLEHEDITARPLTRNDLEDDLRAVNSSLEIIRNSRGGSWPSEEIEEDFDLLDLAWHEREFRDNLSFAYVVYKGDKYIGCFYLYPMGTRVSLSDDNKECDIDASWWVTTEAHESGYYERLYGALKKWLGQDFPFNKPYFSNKDIPI